MYYKPDQTAEAILAEIENSGLEVEVQEPCELMLDWYVRIGKSDRYFYSYAETLLDALYNVLDDFTDYINGREEYYTFES